MVTIIKEEDFRRAKTIFKVEIDSMNIKDWETARDMLYGQLIDEKNKYKRAFEIFKKIEYKKQSASELLGLTQINIETENLIITNEEAELLEEVINYGTKDN